MKYSDKAVEKLITSLASTSCGCCPSELGFKDLSNVECDLVKHSKCEKCWIKALAGDDKCKRY